MPTILGVRPIRVVLSTIAAPAVWLERARGRRRLGLILLYLLVATIPAAYWWRALNIAGIPDIGDPFDAAEFREPDVPDDQNAYFFYVLARARWNEDSTPTIAQRGVAIRQGWEKASPTVRQWLEMNRDAVGLWRRGTERLEYVSLHPKDGTPDRDMAKILETFSWMARLEAARRESEGDMAAAWDWYRGVLRSSRHIGKRGSGEDLMMGTLLFEQARGQVERWAADKRTDAAMIRRALADVISFDAMTAPNSDALKSLYLAEMKDLDHPSKELMESTREEYDQLVDGTRWYHHVVGTAVSRHAQWFLANEPERSRCILRLVLANQLAEVDKPPDLQPWVVDDRLFNVDADPTAPSKARALPAQELNRLYVGPGMVKFVDRIHAFGFRGDLRDLNGLERATRADLIVFLAEQLRLREKGELPGSANELVGPYMKEIPRGYRGPRRGRSGTPRKMQVD